MCEYINKNIVDLWPKKKAERYMLNVKLEYFMFDIKDIW